MTGSDSLYRITVARSKQKYLAIKNLPTSKKIISRTMTILFFRITVAADPSRHFGLKKNLQDRYLLTCILFSHNTVFYNFGCFNLFASCEKVRISQLFCEMHRSFGCCVAANASQQTRKYCIIRFAHYKLHLL